MPPTPTSPATQTTADPPAAPGAAAGVAGARGAQDALGALDALYEGVRSKFPAGSITPVPADAGLDRPTWIVERGVLADLARELRDNRETRFDLLMDVAGVDFPDRPERFEAVYHLYSVPRNARLRVKGAVAGS